MAKSQDLTPPPSAFGPGGTWSFADDLAKAEAKTAADLFSGPVTYRRTGNPPLQVIESDLKYALRASKALESQWSPKQLTALEWPNVAHVAGALEVLKVMLLKQEGPFAAFSMPAQLACLLLYQSMQAPLYGGGNDR
jgi:hypothetical protein